MDDWKDRLSLRNLCSAEHDWYSNYILPKHLWDYNFAKTVEISTEQYQILQWKIECLQQKYSWDENSEPHWMPYTHKKRNKGKVHPKIKLKHSQSAPQCLQEMTGLDNQIVFQVPDTGKKGLFIYDTKVGKQFWARHKKTTTAWYTQNN